jgi:hypothetical protein
MDPQPARPLCVLAVDDHRDTTDSVCQMLTLWGYRPLAAYGAAIALAAAIEGQPAASGPVEGDRVPAGRGLVFPVRGEGGIVPALWRHRTSIGWRRAVAEPAAWLLAACGRIERPRGVGTANALRVFRVAPESGFSER